MSTFGNSLFKKKLDLEFQELKRAARVNFAFEFVLKILEDGSFSFLMLTRTIRFWRGRKLGVRQTTLPT